MKFHRWKVCFVLTGLLVATTLTTLAFGQIKDAASARPVASEIDDAIPAAALRTQRGRQLAERLMQLRRAEATMGPKHPSLGAIQAEIADVKDQLGAWPADVATLNDEDVKRLVLRMSVKIEQLEARIVALERQMRVH